jgi:hypothetical protein
VPTNATDREKEILAELKLFDGKLLSLKKFKLYLSVLDEDVSKLNVTHFKCDRVQSVMKLVGETSGVELWCCSRRRS